MRRNFILTKDYYNCESKGDEIKVNGASLYFYVYIYNYLYFSTYSLLLLLFAWVILLILNKLVLGLILILDKFRLSDDTNDYLSSFELDWTFMWENGEDLNEDVYVN